ncbi:hypothetical protein PGT21_033590 [Puccinia graminis f. sp. tritici]|uniref:Uncharacterized protein n=1 Tax=Puccinia graminis f. sp. tritici TaxID=56615 RepID=A0A5B0Q794_PUCGR|nr:hypothetical protein PGT21_033590 [Puccinia graminis f. sp. tritici]
MRSCASFRSFCFNSKIVYGALGALSKSRPQTSTINPEEKDRVFLSSINDNRHDPPSFWPDIIILQVAFRPVMIK